MSTTTHYSRSQILLCAGLLVLGLFMIVAGFHMGDLAQQVARAGELLREGAHDEAAGGALMVEIADYMAAVAGEVFATRLWLVVLGVFATWIPVLARETPPLVRFGCGALGTLCFAAMLLSGSIP